jgi:NADH-quinone oxidoreductase subunit C
VTTSDKLNTLGEQIAADLGEAVKSFAVTLGELNIYIHSDALVRVLTYLRDEPHCRFVCFIDISGIDYPERENRFDVVYHLLSPYRNLRVRVKIETGDGTPIPSVIDVFPGANWYEREAFDLYGILFSGHPDLRRILTDYGFSGHPLRKDFPLTGHVEVRYDDEQKRVVYDKVKLTQEFRNFDYLSPWEGTEYLLPGDEKPGVKAK